MLLAGESWPIVEDCNTQIMYKVGCAILIAFFSLASVRLGAQVYSEQHYVDAYELVCDSASAEYTGYFDYEDTVAHRGMVSLMTADDILLCESARKGRLLETREGMTTWYYDSGRIRSTAEYLNNKLHGQVMTYYPSGQLRRADLYEHGKLTTGRCYTESGQDMSHYPYEVPVQFPGGEQNFPSFLAREIRYPAISKEYGVAGTVVLNLYVDELGEVQGYGRDTFRREIVYGAATDADAAVDALFEEVMRLAMLIKRWEPRRVEGVAVSGIRKFAVRFRLS